MNTMSGTFSEHLVVLLTSFSLCVMIVLASRLMPALRGRSGDLEAKQTAHKSPTPRIGGIAVFASLCLALGLSPVSIDGPYAIFAGAAALLFCVGLAEDLGVYVSPRNRLIAAGLSSMLVMGVLGVWLSRIDVPVVDALLAYWPIGVLLTLVATVGVANGFNLIDGVNGLAALVSICAGLGLGAIASAGGYVQMAAIAPMVATAILGFALLNYPFGLIFLGDAGAYTLGFVLSWFGISIVLNVPEASAWAILLVMFWPVADTMLAIYRRARRRVGAMHPDRLHMHQLVMRGLEACLLGPERRLLANSLTTLVLAPFVVTSTFAGVLYWDQPLISAGLAGSFSVLFVACYLMGPRVVRRFRRRWVETGRTGVVQPVEAADKVL